MKLLDWLKKERVLEQIVYDASYEGKCPVCHMDIEANAHDVKFLSKTPNFSKKLLTECTNCRVAFYTDRTSIVKRLKKYVRDDKEWLGLRVISEERIP